MDEAMGAVVEKLERLESSLRQYREEWLSWQKEQEERNRCSSTTIACIYDSLDGLALSLNARQRNKISVPEAARYAKVKCATVRRWLADGKLKGVKIGNLKQSRWRIRRQDLDALLERATNFIK